MTYVPEFVALRVWDKSVLHRRAKVIGVRMWVMVFLILAAAAVLASLFPG